MEMVTTPRTTTALCKHHDFGNNLSKQEMLKALNCTQNHIVSAFYTGARNTGKILVQFACDHLPFTIKPAQYINAGEELDVHLSLLRPIRCNNCQRHGHKNVKMPVKTVNNARIAPIQTISGSNTKRDSKNIEMAGIMSPPNCAACYEAKLTYVGHPVTSKTCPVYLKCEQIVMEKNNKSIAAREAERAIYKRKNENPNN